MLQKSGENMEDKLVFTVYKPNAVDKRGNVIRIDGEALVILNELQRETGLPIKTLASRMIEFAAEYVKINVVSFSKE